MDRKTYQIQNWQKHVIKPRTRRRRVLESYQPLGFYHRYQVGTLPRYAATILSLSDLISTYSFTRLGPQG